MATPQDWTRAYALQARTDFECWNLLQTGSAPLCQRLHFLQMACEKLSKAHMIHHGTAPGLVQARHNYTTTVLPAALEEQLRVVGQASQWPALQGYARRLAQEIDFLAPSVDDNGQRPDNCEYPWEDALGVLHSPLTHSFAVGRLLVTPRSLFLLKLVSNAIDRLRQR